MWLGGTAFLSEALTPRPARVCVAAYSPPLLMPASTHSLTSLPCQKAWLHSAHLVTLVSLRIRFPDRRNRRTCRRPSVVSIGERCRVTGSCGKSPGSRRTRRPSTSGPPPRLTSTTVGGRPRCLRLSKRGFPFGLQKLLGISQGYILHQLR